MNGCKIRKEEKIIFLRLISCWLQMVIAVFSAAFHSRQSSLTSGDAFHRLIFFLINISASAKWKQKVINVSIYFRIVLNSQQWPWRLALIGRLGTCRGSEKTKTVNLRRKINPVSSNVERRREGRRFKGRIIDLWFSSLLIWAIYWHFRNEYFISFSICPPPRLRYYSSLRWYINIHIWVFTTHLFRIFYPVA